MSSLTYTEKQLFEKIFKMGDGHLLDFSHARLQEFMNDFKVDLGSEKYDKYGSSKAKRFRAFWEIEPDMVLTPVLEALLENANQNGDITPKDNELAIRCVNRMKGNEAHRNLDVEMPTAEEAVINNRIWGNGKFRIFLSHKAEYKVETAKLQKELAAYGISSFVAHNDIEPTREWQDEIENALHTMDVLVALLTEGFQQSNWTDQEIGFALGRKKQVIAVRMGTDPYGFIGRYQAVTATWDNAAVNIIKALMKHEKMIGIYIELMRQCKSFASGNKLAEFLPYMESISDVQAKVMIEIYHNNNQVMGSAGFTGSDPEKYGSGIVHHLNRTSTKIYRFDDDWNIREVQ
jgi:hypothetical protein